MISWFVIRFSLFDIHFSEVSSFFVIRYSEVSSFFVIRYSTFIFQKLVRFSLFVIRHSDSDFFFQVIMLINLV